MTARKPKARRSSTSQELLEIDPELEVHVSLRGLGDDAHGHHQELQNHQEPHHGQELPEGRDPDRGGQRIMDLVHPRQPFLPDQLSCVEDQEDDGEEVSGTSDQVHHPVGHRVRGQPIELVRPPKGEAHVHHPDEEDDHERRAPQDPAEVHPGLTQHLPEVGGCREGQPGVRQVRVDLEVGLDVGIQRGHLHRALLAQPGFHGEPEDPDPEAHETCRECHPDHTVQEEIPAQGEGLGIPLGHGPILGQVLQGTDPETVDEDPQTLTLQVAQQDAGDGIRHQNPDGRR
jgi:hypothetical protein